MQLVLFRTPDTFQLIRLRRELAEARNTLHSRERLLSESRAQLISFEGRYLRQVGVLYRRLDEWERKLAELHGTPQAAEEEAEAFEAEDTAVGSLFDPAALKAIFRDLVKVIHPDFSKDAEDERRRTRLMTQANDAYLREDADALRRMLHGYDPAIARTSQEGVRAEVTRLMAMIFQVTQDIEAVNLQIEELLESDSAKLQERALQAARQGRDLLAEMAARVNGSIGMAMRCFELDQTRVARPAKGPSVEELVTAETSRS